jgi:membrane dipeptidase
MQWNCRELIAAGLQVQSSPRPGYNLGMKPAILNSIVIASGMIVVLVAVAPARFDGARDKDGSPEAAPGTVVTVSERARDLHRRSLVFDGHNDLPWEVRQRPDRFNSADIAVLQPGLHTDIPRLREGGVGAVFWSAYTPSDSPTDRPASRQVLEQIDLIQKMIERYPDAFEAAANADDVERIRKAGKIASLIGLEGGHAIDNSLEVLRELFSRGSRYMTLTHSETNDLADSATDKPRHAGLSELGRDVVREMNRLGMIVDISHVSPDTMRDVLELSSAPVIASHSSAFAVAPHPRNVPDDVLKLIKANRGVVMVNFYSGFVVPENAVISESMLKMRSELKAKFSDATKFQRAYDEWKAANPLQKGSIRDVVDHIDHIVKIAGIDHVGLGSDFDGVSMLPQDLEDVSTFPRITQVLLDRNYSENDIQKILGGNTLRVLREVGDHARP